MDDSQTLPPAGWYSDPSDTGSQRWWNGAGWTEHRQRIAATPPASAYASSVYPEPHAPASSPSSAYVPMSQHADWAYSSTSTINRDPLTLPLYGATIGQAYNRFWRKYATFRGRASQSEYWWWSLIASVAYIIWIVVSGILTNEGQLTALETGLAALVFLATVVPSLALTVRRLHDSDLSGWFLLLIFAPFGSVVLLFLAARAMNPAGARFD